MKVLQNFSSGQRPTSEILQIFNSGQRPTGENGETPRLIAKRFDDNNVDEFLMAKGLDRGA